MFFCKEDISSVNVLHQCILLFSKAFELQANSSESDVYTAGDQPTIIVDIRALANFTIGSLPFNYLGVPHSSRRLFVAECEQLADKMLDKIKGCSVKHLLYVAHLQIINSILMGISAYWCQIFIITKGVIKCINSICRTFLWFGVANPNKHGLVKWKEVYKPKKVGGLG